MSGAVRVLVTGGRDYADWPTFRRTMIDLNAELGIGLIVHGECPTGADKMAAAFAAQRGIPCAGMKAHWHALGKKAGPIRNGWMIDLLKPDLVVGFPGGTGTAGCLALARAAGVEVREVAP